MRKLVMKIFSAGAIGLILAGSVAAAHAQDFFSQFFGGYGRRVERPQMRMPFAPDFQQDEYGRGTSEGQVRYGGGSQAYCVRTCDGRYFPTAANSDQSKAASCNSFCPASETRVFYGNNIDNAVSDNGRRYSELPNAFKYRTELVAGCTCNGKPTGLAPVKVEDDPTLRRGDIVAGADGLMVTRSTERRGAALAFSPVAASIKAKFQRPPVVASE